ncbi:MAG: DUF960 domain-containing protein [Ruminococcus sp.]|nr:DUF960 domain-containing protein [Ruminococcus sp.]
MFEKWKKRYLTRGVDTRIPLDLQIFMWDCIDNLPEERNYLQVFQLSEKNGLQEIQHTSEQPKFEKTYVVRVENPVNEKVYVIDDEEHCTMLLAEEY